MPEDSGVLIWWRKSPRAVLGRWDGGLQHHLAPDWCKMFQPGDRVHFPQPRGVIPEMFGMLAMWEENVQSVSPAGHALTRVDTDVPDIVGAFSADAPMGICCIGVSSRLCIPRTSVLIVSDPGHSRSSRPTAKPICTCRTVHSMAPDLTFQLSEPQTSQPRDTSSRGSASADCPGLPWQFEISRRQRRSSRGPVSAQAG